VPAKLYSMVLSHPSQAAHLMLERKGIAHEVKDLFPGGHPVQLRLAGFRGGTVPGLKVDGRRVQGSLNISRALDELQAEPRLFPADPEQRRAVEDAEAWGEGELQPVPRRMFRWGASRRQSMRVWMVRDMGMPAPDLMARAQKPLAHAFARMADVSDERVRADIAALPAQLDHIDGLIAAGVIGGAEPNAADFQIGTTVRVFLAYEDILPLVEGRPAGELAMRLLPRFPGPIPPFLPPEWLAAVR
jgi:glutathione S-transferase